MYKKWTLAIEYKDEATLESESWELEEKKLLIECRVLKDVLKTFSLGTSQICRRDLHGMCLKPIKMLLLFYLRLGLDPSSHYHQLLLHSNTFRSIGVSQSIITVIADAASSILLFFYQKGGRCHDENQHQHQHQP